MHRSIAGGLLLLLCLGGVGESRSQTVPIPDSLESGFHDFEEISLESVLDVRVTTAARHEQSLGEAANAVTVVTADEIRAYGYETLADILRNQAGMHVTNDRNYENVGIRGFAPPGDYNTRVLVLVDGHPMNDIIWSYAGIGTDQPIDLSLVERIEILRGPGSALYGTNAIFGTINFITRPPGGASELTAEGGGGSHGCRQGSISVRTGDQGPLCALVGFSAMEADGADLYVPEFSGKGGDGWVRDSDEDRYRRAFLSAKWGPVTLRSAFSTRTKGIPTAPWDGIIGDPITGTRDRSAFIDLIAERRLPRGLGLLLRAYGHSYVYNGTWPWNDEDSTGVLTRWVDTEREEGRSAGLEARLDWQPGSRHRLLIGGEGRRDWSIVDFDRTRPELDRIESIIDRKDASGFYSAYLQDEWRVIPRLTATAGCHLDHYPAFGGHATPRVALVFDAAPETRLKALYGEGFKAPCYGERLYYDDVTQIANPDLRPELYRSGELVAEHAWSPHTWSRLSAYLGEVEDQIRLSELEDGMLQYRNAGRAGLLGAEFEARAHLPGAVQARGHLARQEVRTLDPEAWAPNSPRWLAGIGLCRPWVGGGSIAVDTRYVGTRRSVQEGVDITGYLIADLNLRIPLPLSGWEAALKVGNLGDRHYSDPGGEEHRMAAIEQDGRTWRFSLRRIGPTH